MQILKYIIFFNPSIKNNYLCYSINKIINFIIVTRIGQFFYYYLNVVNIKYLKFKNYILKLILNKLIAYVILFCIKEEEKDVLKIEKKDILITEKEVLTTEHEINDFIDEIVDILNL